MFKHVLPLVQPRTPSIACADSRLSRDSQSPFFILQDAGWDACAGDALALDGWQGAGAIDGRRECATNNLGFPSDTGRPK